MRSVAGLTLMVVAVLLCGALAVVAEEEEAAKKVDVPAKVMEAFKASFPDVVISSVDSEVKDGKTLYEIETVQDSAEVDYVYAEDGTLIQIEEEISVESLPEIVVTAIKAAHEGCEIDEAEKITRGETVEYEVAVEVGEDEFELLVASDGTILQPDEAEADDDADEEHEGDDDDEDDDDEDDDEDDE
ncbi:MAG: PepSY-like domain-containing protein [Candidatus Zixiibacteriota bacterium]|nr:MAG: PepSY-like domain-containing protein [candidate division Zixibacteria bacterium]